MNQQYATIKLPLGLYQRVQAIKSSHALEEVLELGLRLKKWQTTETWDGEYWNADPVWLKMEAEADVDIANSDISGPFDNAEEFISSMKQEP